MPRMKIYRGRRDERDQPHVTVNGRPLRHIQYHTNAFDWGQSNDGAADLALSMLANYFGERPNPESKRFLSGEYVSWRLHQDFMADVTACMSCARKKKSRLSSFPYVQRRCVSPS
jgi:hypothetical protein